MSNFAFDFINLYLTVLAKSILQPLDKKNLNTESSPINSIIPNLNIRYIVPIYTIA